MQNLAQAKTFVREQLRSPLNSSQSKQVPIDDGHMLYYDASIQLWFLCLKHFSIVMWGHWNTRLNFCYDKTSIGQFFMSIVFFLLVNSFNECRVLIYRDHLPFTLIITNKSRFLYNTFTKLTLVTWVKYCSTSFILWWLQPLTILIVPSSTSSTLTLETYATFSIASSPSLRDN